MSRNILLRIDGESRRTPVPLHYIPVWSVVELQGDTKCKPKSLFNRLIQSEQSVAIEESETSFNCQCYYDSGPNMNTGLPQLYKLVREQKWGIVGPQTRVIFLLGGTFGLEAPPFQPPPLDVFEGACQRLKALVRMSLFSGLPGARSVLLHGSPGSGKASMVQAVIEESGARIIAFSPDQFVGGVMGMASEQPDHLLEVSDVDWCRSKCLLNHTPPLQAAFMRAINGSEDAPAVIVIRKMEVLFPANAERGGGPAGNISAILLHQFTVLMRRLQSRATEGVRLGAEGRQERVLVVGITSDVSMVSTLVQ
jgi:hypothetical protein